MKIDTQKMVSVALMVAGVCLMISIGAGAVACTQLRTSDTVAIAPVDNAAEQASRAVYVRLRRGNTIYGSSGVAIGGTLVITAAHAIPCAGDLWITTKSGVTLWATIKSIRRDNDTAVISAEGLNSPPVRLGASPHRGDTVCAATAHPVRGRICAPVLYVGSGMPGAIISGLEVVSGNSGAGVYDTSGALVGIVVTGCGVPGCGRSGASEVGPGR